MAEEATNMQVETVVKSILNTIDKEREREIISRRFGLYDRKETLEQIGELLGITRERVRQLEKAIITRLKAQAEQGSVPHITEVEAAVSELLDDNGAAARVSVLSEKLTGKSDKLDQSRVAFLAVLCPKLTVVDENDFYHQSVALASVYKDTKALITKVDGIVKTVKSIGKPSKVKAIALEAKSDNEKRVEALASISKLLAHLNGDWGLTKWPTVNPKNIRDKIYVILRENGKQMHFSEIADKIKESDFKRKDVTTQAIHNELIKDDRFVLVGRGIYALKEWGFKKGTVSDVIAEILKKANEPLHRDEIVKRVLKNRYVKETTILLNLQGKKQFKRVAKATYALAEE
jgi:hypothetical protein